MDTKKDKIEERVNNTSKTDTIIRLIRTGAFSFALNFYSLSILHKTITKSIASICIGLPIYSTHRIYKIRITLTS